MMNDSAKAKYAELIERLSTLRRGLEFSTVSELENVADAFRVNVERVFDLGELPARMLERGYHQAIASMAFREKW